MKATKSTAACYTSWIALRQERSYAGRDIVQVRLGNTE
jgi:hypothetical protein